MINTTLESPMGHFTIKMGEEEINHSLQGWNSADLYILSQIKENYNEVKNILVTGDNFGPLTVALAGEKGADRQIYLFGDSFCDRQATLRNLKENGLDSLVGKSVHLLSPDTKLPGNIDLFVMKNPKSLKFLTFELNLFASSFKAGTPFIAADMSRNIHSSTIEIFEDRFEDVKSSLAWKKARLIEGTVASEVREIVGKSEKELVTRYTPLEEEFEVVNHAGLFAYGRLDPGTAHIMSHFPRLPEEGLVIDLACGDGILGLKAAKMKEGIELLLTDESYLAVRSAKETFSLAGLESRAKFTVDDGLKGVDDSCARLVLCNPPFHQNHSLSTATALDLFKQSHRVLETGGELFVIANRHLGYDKSLAKIFSKAHVIKNNKKFSIIRAIK